MGNEQSTCKNRNSFNQFKDDCKNLQKHFSYQLGDRIWDKFRIPEEENYLHQKIEFVLFGLHMEENGESKLTDQQKERVDEIKSKCISHSIDKTEIHMAVLFINVFRIKTMQTTLVPLFRVMSHKDERLDGIKENVFIDHTGRVYHNWAKYLNENTWDMSIISVPYNGYYSSEKNYCIVDQRSQGRLTDALNATSTFSDIVTSATIFAGAAMTVFPPTAPIGISFIFGGTLAGAPAAIYGVGRSINTLADREKHEKSIGLDDFESRQCWLNMASSVLFGTSEIISNVAKTGQLVSTVTKVAVQALHITSTSFDGLGLIRAIYDLLNKVNITSLDIHQLRAFIFFFTHSVVTFMTANGIINDAKMRQLTHMTDRSTAEQITHEDNWDRSNDVIEHRQDRQMEGRVKFIKEMRKIDNVEEFYSHFEIKFDIN